MLSSHFLGVDGGQSGTTAVIGDQHGNIIGWAAAGPCNHVAAAEARARFLQVMRGCISEAASRAGMTTSGDRWSFNAACLGMSGGPADKSSLLHELVDAEHIVVTDDAAIALAGATTGEPGIVVIGGTGSIAFGRNERGETARVGGWGYIFGDEGSAFDIVRQALRVVLRAHEGWGARTALTPALLEASGATDANDLLHLFYKPEWPRSRVAELARIVNQIAEEGDPLAIGILHNAARELALLAGSVHCQLWGEAEQNVIVSWVGGVFGSAMLLERFRALVTLISPAGDRVFSRAPLHGPATGALLLAYRAADLAIMPKQLL